MRSSARGVVSYSNTEFERTCASGPAQQGTAQAVVILPVVSCCLAACVCVSRGMVRPAIKSFARVTGAQQC
jgi:hypothetical protein